MSECTLHTFDKLKEFLKDVRFIDYKNKYKQKSHSPYELAHIVSDVISKKDTNELQNSIFDKEPDGTISYKYDTLTTASMSSLVLNLEYAFKNNLKLDLLTNGEPTKLNNGLSTTLLPPSYKRGIAISNLLNSISEYVNKAKNAYGDDYRDHISHDNGALKFNANNIAHLIGREITTKSGFIYTGKDRYSKYLKIGYDILNELQKDDFIKITENDQIPVFNMFNAKENKRYGIYTKSNDDVNLKDIKTIKGTSVSFNSTGSKIIDSLLKGEPTKYKDKKINNIYDLYTVLKNEQEGSNSITNEKELTLANQLVIATNLGSVYTPFNEAKVYTDKNAIPEEQRKNVENDLSTMKLYNHLKNDDGLEDIDLAKTAKDMESKPYYIRKEYLEILKIMANQWKDYITTQIQSHKPFSIKSFLNTDVGSQYKSLFKIDLKDDTGVYKSTYEDLESDIGKERTRTLAVFNVLNELNKNPELQESGRFYKMFFRGANARIYNALISLNEEGDKVISRNIIQRVNEPMELNTFDNNGKLSYGMNTFITNMKNLLPNDISQYIDNKFIQSLIDNQDKTYAEKVDLLKKSKLSNTKLSKLLTDLLNFKNLLNSKDDHIEKDKNIQTLVNNISSLYANENITHTINGVLMFNDLFNMKDNKINTTFSTEVDARSSGLTLAITNSLGQSEEAYNFLGSTGILNNKNKPDVEGGYEYVLDNINRLFTKDNSSSDAESLLQAHNGETSKIEPAGGSELKSFKNEAGKEKLKVAQSLWDYFTKDLNMNARNIIKSPTMTTSVYQQEVHNAAKGEVSKRIVKELKNKVFDKHNEIDENGVKILQHIFTQTFDLLDNKDKNTILSMLGDTVKQQENKNMLLKNDSKDTQNIIDIYNDIADNKKFNTFVTTLIKNNLSLFLSEESKAAFEPMFSKDLDQLKGAYDKLESLFGMQGILGTDLSKFKMIDPSLAYKIVNSMEGKDSGSNLENAIEQIYNNKGYTEKSYLSLTSFREAIDPDTGITAQIELPNRNTLTVSSIHALDATLLGKTLQDFKKIIPENEWNNFNVSTIHDAMITHSKYAKTLMDLYTKNYYDLASKIDRSLLFYKTIRIELDSIKEPNEEVNKFKTKLDALINERKQVLNNRKSIIEKEQPTEFTDKIIRGDTENFDVKQSTNINQEPANTNSKPDLQTLQSKKFSILAKDLSPQAEELIKNNKLKSIQLKKNSNGKLSIYSKNVKIADIPKGLLDKYKSNDIKIQLDNVSDSSITYSIHQKDKIDNLISFIKKNNVKLNNVKNKLLNTYKGSFENRIRTFANKYNSTDNIPTENDNKLATILNEYLKNDKKALELMEKECRI